MASTRTPGITIDANGNRIINKEHHGARLFVRLGDTSQDCAEQRLRDEIEHLDLERHRKAHARPLFCDCAVRYLAQSHQRRTLDTIGWHT